MDPFQMCMYSSLFKRVYTNSNFRLSLECVPPVPALVLFTVP